MLGIGAASLAIAVPIIALLPLDAPIRLLLGVLWFVAEGTCLWRLARIYRRVRSYTLLPDGRVLVEDEGGYVATARFAAGSTITRRLVWLRVRPLSGRPWGELLAAPDAFGGRPGEQPGRAEIEAWRRFQVICRYVSAC